MQYLRRVGLHIEYVYGRTVDTRFCAHGLDGLCGDPIVPINVFISFRALVVVIEGRELMLYAPAVKKRCKSCIELTCETVSFVDVSVCK